MQLNEYDLIQKNCWKTGENHDIHVKVNAWCEFKMIFMMQMHRLNS